MNYVIEKHITKKYEVTDIARFLKYATFVVAERGCAIPQRRAFVAAISSPMTNIHTLVWLRVTRTVFFASNNFPLAKVNRSKAITESYNKYPNLRKQRGIVFSKVRKCVYQKRK